MKNIVTWINLTVRIVIMFFFNIATLSSTKIRYVSKSIAIWISLVSVGLCWTIITNITKNLAIAIFLTSIHYRRAIVITIINVPTHTFNPLDLRQDIGSIWHNFLNSEHIKSKEYNSINGQHFYWPSYSVLDYLKELNGPLIALDNQSKSSLGLFDAGHSG